MSECIIACVAAIYSPHLAHLSQDTPLPASLHPAYWKFLPPYPVSLTHWIQAKTVILQTTFSNAFLWEKMLKFHWSLFPMSTWNWQYSSISWEWDSGLTKKATSHYLNEWCPRLLMHISLNELIKWANFYPCLLCYAIIETNWLTNFISKLFVIILGRELGPSGVSPNQCSRWKHMPSRH